MEQGSTWVLEEQGNRHGESLLGVLRRKTRSLFYVRIYLVLKLKLSRAFQIPISVRNPWEREMLIDPDDTRGQALFFCRGVLDESVMVLWRSLVRLLDFDHYIDVGANYGEVTLSTNDYRTDSVHVFEPNPRIAPYLQLNLAGSHTKVNILAASNRAGPCQLYVDPLWSGTGSVEDTSLPVAEQVQATTLDNYTSTFRRSGDRFLVKVDVEGHEEAVVEGFLQSLQSAGKSVLILEARSAEDAVRLRTCVERVWNEIGVYYLLDSVLYRKSPLPDRDDKFDLVLTNFPLLDSVK